jgi:hypothetical protein
MNGAAVGTQAHAITANAVAASSSPTSTIADVKTRTFYTIKKGSGITPQSFIDGMKQGVIEVSANDDIQQWSRAV